MLSVLMHVVVDDDDRRASIYGELIESITEITSDSDVDGKPISEANMQFRWPPRGLRAEIDATVGSRNRLLWSAHVYLSSIFQFLLDKFDVSAGGYRWLFP